MAAAAQAEQNPAYRHAPQLRPQPSRRRRRLQL